MVLQLKNSVLYLQMRVAQDPNMRNCVSSIATFYMTANSLVGDKDGSEKQYNMSLYTKETARVAFTGLISIAESFKRIVGYKSLVMEMKAICKRIAEMYDFRCCVSSIPLIHFKSTSFYTYPPHPPLIPDSRLSNKQQKLVND